MGWRRTWNISFYLFYFSISLIGFWKIRNSLLSQRLGDLIVYSICIGFFAIYELIFLIMFRGHLESIKLKWCFISFLKCYIVILSILGYIAFFYPLLYRGVDITDNEFIGILMPILFCSGLPLIIDLLIKILRKLLKK